MAPMRREASDIGGGGTVISYGHWGRPVLVFPSEQGRAYDYENNGMVGAVADLIDAGRVKLYCVDSFDAQTWSRADLPLEERARRHGAYESWIIDHVVPFVHADCGGPTDIATTGCSLGAFHAVNFALKRADLFPLAIGLSGNYDAAAWNSWGERGDATYFNNPVDYVARLGGDHLDWLLAAVDRARRRAGRVGDAPDRCAAVDPPVRGAAAGQGHSLRARPVGVRRRARLALVATAAGPSPAQVLLSLDMPRSTRLASES
jgi:esterase/lipase superfamily enzyme